MKILHVTRRFWPFIGGVETYIYEIGKRLVAQGNQCRVLTLDYDIQNRNNHIAKSGMIDEIEIIRIGGFGYYKKPLPLKLPIDQFQWADIVHIHDIRFLYETTLLLKLLSKYKIVLSTHGFLLHSGEWRFVKDCVIPLYYRPTMRRWIDEIICVSRQDYEYFRSWEMDNLNLIENGIDYAKFNIDKLNQSSGNFLYFGRVDSNKGIDLLFNCLASMTERSWTLNIVGEGRYEVTEQLKALASSLGIGSQLVWHGFVDQQKLSSLLGQSEICFFPSKYEGFGLTLVEAMAAGCICVANEIPTYKAVIQNQCNGFLTDFRKRESVMSIVKEIMKMSEVDKRRISGNAKETALNYDWSRKIVEILAVYKKALNG